MRVADQPDPRLHGEAACSEHFDLFMAAIDRGCDTYTNRAITTSCVVICQSCPVLALCREWSLGISGEQHGVLGGLDAQQRADLIRRRR